MCMLPATISNNVPGTDLSLGADTALNAIVEVRQERKHSLFSSLRRPLSQRKIKLDRFTLCFDSFWPLESPVERIQEL